MRTGLLRAKLVTGKGQHFEAARAVFIDNLGELGIVRLGLSSFRSHIDYQEDRASIVRHDDLLTVHVLIDGRIEAHFSRCLFNPVKQTSGCVLKLSEGPAEEAGHRPCEKNEECAEQNKISRMFDRSHWCLGTVLL